MKAKTGLYICLSYFLIFSAAFAFIVPAFEAPDEVGHIAYINFLQKHRTLPNQLSDSLKEPLQGHQPPLYYMILYSVNYVFDSDKPIEIKLSQNPLHVWNHGKNQHVPFFMHTSGLETTQSFFYVFRIISILIGMMNLLFIYKIALMFLKDEMLALMPVIFAATLPQFAFISGAVNNDNLANLFSTFSIYYLLKIFTDPPNIRNYILAGLSIGLGVITKKTVYFIFPVFAITVTCMFISNTPMNRKRIITGTALAIITLILISAQYIIHNIMSYNEILGLKEEYSTFGVFDSHGLFTNYFIYPFSHEFFKSFVGYPGLINVLMPKVFYIFYAVVCAAAIIFALISLKKSISENKSIVILVISILSCISGIIYFNTLLSQFQGRFLFPVISAVAVALIIGLKEITHLIRNIKITSYLTFGLIIAFVIADIISIYVTYKFYFTPSQYGM